jgi:hypothetical protein
MIIGMRPIRQTDTTIQEVGSELLVLDQQQESLNQLNSTAAWVFARCDGSRTLDELLAELMQTYDVPHEIAHQDLLSVLRELADLGLIELAED